MKLNLTNPGETKTQNELKERVLSTIMEYAGDFENAMIEVFFIASYSNQGDEITKEQIDFLRLLYKVLQDAKKINQPVVTNTLINEIINS